MSGVVAALMGAAVGSVVTALLIVRLMRTRMVVPMASARSFEATCAAVECEVPAAAGWSFPAPALDMFAKLDARGHAPAGLRRIQLYFVCNPSIAGRVLSAAPQMAGIMPCSWAVYERTDGSVWLAKMNIGLMARMFTGAVGTAMGEVAAADEGFMASVLRAESGAAAPAAA